jgi:hypothetical protein
MIDRAACVGRTLPARSPAALAGALFSNQRSVRHLSAPGDVADAAQDRPRPLRTRLSRTGSLRYGSGRGTIHAMLSSSGSLRDHVGHPSDVQSSNYSGVCRWNFQEVSSSAGKGRLLAMDVVSFDAALQERLRGPEGTDLRRAHLLELFARRLFRGDYHRAAAAMETSCPELDGRSPREAATTQEGMLEVKSLIEKKAAKPRQCGVGVMLQALEDGWRDEYEPLLDLLPAAWGLTDEEFEPLLGVRPGWLRWWRQEKSKLGEQLRNRLRHLRQFSEAVRLVARREDYPLVWRTVWEPGSPIGERSPWEAVRDAGTPALDLLEEYFRALASGELVEWYERRRAGATDNRN